MALFSGKSIRKKVTSKAEYRDAIVFAQTYNPREGVDYEWVICHAVEEYARLEKISEVLDTKAHSLIGYMGAGSGLIAFVFTYVTEANNLMSAMHVFPALVAMLAGIVYAAKARSPEAVPGPLHTRDAFEYADGLSTIARVSFAAMTGAAAIGMKLANEEKARLIRAAFRSFVFAAAWLALFAFLIRVVSLLSLSIVTFFNPGG